MSSCGLHWLPTTVVYFDPRTLYLVHVVFMSRICFSALQKQILNVNASKGWDVKSQWLKLPYKSIITFFDDCFSNIWEV